MVQWSSKAKEILQQERQEFEQQIKQTAPKILNKVNMSRNRYGLPPLKRITKEVIQETILYLLENTVSGDVKSKKINKFEDRGDYV